MSTILAGHVQLQDQADQARDALLRAGFPEDQISIFYVNQPGQHDLMAVGGDEPASAGAKETPLAVTEGMAAGGAVGAMVGLATSVATGPIGPAVGALVGAHVGSLFSFSKMKEAGEQEAGGGNVIEPRAAGMIISVALAKPDEEGRALDVLHQIGAHHIERAEGHIRAGDWIDFNPLSLPKPVY